MKTLIIEPVRLDILAKEKMGTERDGALEALLAANPGVSASGPFVTAPAIIEIPAAPQKTPVVTVSPWD